MRRNGETARPISRSDERRVKLHREARIVSDTNVSDANVVTLRDREGKCRGRVLRSRSLFTVPMKVGNSPLEDPLEGRDEAGSWNRNGKHGQDSDLEERVNDTKADSRAGEETRGESDSQPRPSHRHWSVAGCVCADEEGWCTGSRWCHGRGLRTGTE